MSAWLRRVWPWSALAKLRADVAMWRAGHDVYKKMLEDELTEAWKREARHALAPLPAPPPEERELEGAFFTGEWVKFYIGEEGFKFPLEDMQWLLKVDAPAPAATPRPTTLPPESAE